MVKELETAEKNISKLVLNTRTNGKGIYHKI